MMWSRSELSLGLKKRVTVTEVNQLTTSMMWKSREHGKKSTKIGETAAGRVTLGFGTNTHTYYSQILHITLNSTQHSQFYKLPINFMCDTSRSYVLRYLQFYILQTILHITHNSTWYSQFYKLSTSLMCDTSHWYVLPYSQFYILQTILHIFHNFTRHSKFYKLSTNLMCDTSRSNVLHSSQNSYWDCYGSFDEQRLFSVKFARFRNFFDFA